MGTEMRGTKMNKRMKKMKVMLAALLAIALTLGMAPMAFAEDDPRILEAAITKVLKVPIGTEYPEMTFDFSVTAVSFNESTTQTSGMPEIGDHGVVSIAFNGATATPRDEEFEGTVDGISTYYLESDELFGAIDWPTAGIYEYLIEETGTDYVIVNGLYEAMELSKATYQLIVYVREYRATDPEVLDDLNPAEEFDRYIYTITMKQITNDEGGADGVGKGDPTPGGNGLTTFYSDMIFTNKYMKNNGGGGGDPTDPDNSILAVTKTVEGDLGSYVLPFNFSLTLSVPDLIDEFIEDYYKGYLVKGDVVLDPAECGVNTSLIGPDTYGFFIKFVPGSKVDFQLKHDEKLVIVSAPVGSSYVFSEAGEAGYIASAKITVDSVQGGIEEGDKGDGISCPSLSNSVYTTPLYVGERANVADVTNTNDSTTPAGIVVENLPFILALLLALGAVAVYVVARQHKRKGEAEDIE